MAWLIGFVLWLAAVFLILRFFQVACAGDDPVDIPPKRSEIDSWPQ